MWQEFFSQAYKLPLLVLKRGMANPMGMFVYGILSKWYILVMVATISVTFWVFKGLEQAGVIDVITNELKYAFRESQAVAQKCVPKIMNLGEMWDCIQHTSGADYVQSDDEKALSNALQHDLQDSETHPNTSPYGTSDTYNPYDDTQAPTDSSAPAPSSSTDGVSRL